MSKSILMLFSPLSYPLTTSLREDTRLNQIDKLWIPVLKTTLDLQDKSAEAEFLITGNIYIIKHENKVALKTTKINLVLKRF